jgi:hypothetical protein
MTNTARGPLASDVTYQIELPNGAGNFQLKQVMTLSVTDNSTGETVQGGAGPIGNIFTTGGFTLTISTHRIASVPNEVDWYALRASRARFVLSMQDGVGETFGTRWTWNALQVSTVNIEGANDANQTMEITAITSEPMQTTQPDAVL